MERREVSDTASQRMFLLAGRAVFTVENEATGNRFTFKVNKSGDPEKVIHFVSLLTGPDNTSDYTYMGTIFDKKDFRRTRKSTMGEAAPAFKAFQYVWLALNNGGLSKKVKFYHEGRCCRCGRALTVPDSIERGIGPECTSKL